MVFELDRTSDLEEGHGHKKHHTKCHRHKHMHKVVKIVVPIVGLLIIVSIVVTVFWYAILFHQYNGWILRDYHQRNNSSYYTADHNLHWLFYLPSFLLFQLHPTQTHETSWDDQKLTVHTRKHRSGSRKGKGVYERFLGTWLLTRSFRLFPVFLQETRGRKRTHLNHLISRFFILSFL